jgi:hypothetical protein
MADGKFSFVVTLRLTTLSSTPHNTVQYTQYRYRAYIESYGQRTFGNIYIVGRAIAEAVSRWLPTRRPGFAPESGK